MFQRKALQFWSLPDGVYAHKHKQAMKHESKGNFTANALFTAFIGHGPIICPLYFERWSALNRIGKEQEGKKIKLFR